MKLLYKIILFVILLILLSLVLPALFFLASTWTSIALIVVLFFSFAACIQRFCWRNCGNRPKTAVLDADRSGGSLPAVVFSCGKAIPLGTLPLFVGIYLDCRACLCNSFCNQKAQRMGGEVLI